ncbi:nitrilase-related carbon-nitrogen hydrolase [Streptomyces krungchingensis]|uniref:nitrilase-related carbon-nitrogen hydrolase n=1 Tax=Streptomyces krungchingensis TaxID=1565034 RepID=UPI003CE745FE
MATTSAREERPCGVRTLRLAVAQSTVPEDPTDRGALRAAGQEIRALMVEASEAGARLVQFPEGAITYPSKYVMAAGLTGELVPADWSRAAWDVMREEAESITALAGRLGLWTVFGSLHPLTPPNQPHNSLYIASDRGRLVARYDKRFLSHTELSYLYSPGHQPLFATPQRLRASTPPGPTRPPATPTSASWPPPNKPRSSSTGARRPPTSLPQSTRLADSSASHRPLVNLSLNSPTPLPGKARRAPDPLSRPSPPAWGERRQGLLLPRGRPRGSPLGRLLSHPSSDARSGENTAACGETTQFR